MNIKNNEKFVEKTILERLLPEADSKMSEQLMTELIFLRDKMEEFSPSPGDFDIQVRSIKDQSCFRIRFSLPVLLHFHCATKNMRRIHGYHKNQSHVFPAGFIPVYNCNLNHLTLLRTYNRVWDWFNKMEENDEDYFCRMFENNIGEPMEQSSLNFLLQNNAVSKLIPDKVSVIVNKCFEYHYWRLPSEGFLDRHSAIHGFIYNSASKINKLSTTYKTIIKIKDIGIKRYEISGYSTIKYAHVEAQIMHQRDNRIIFSQSEKLLMAEPDASRLNPDDIICCIIEKTSHPHPPQTIVHAIIGNKVQRSDLSQWISVSVWNKLNDISKSIVLCKVGPTEEIKRHVHTLLENNPQIFDAERHERFEQMFDESLERIYPLIFEHDESIYHVAPSLVSYLITKDIPVLENKLDLVDFLNFVDTTDPKSPYKNKMKMRTSNFAEKIQSRSYGSNWETILKDIPRVANRIIYSRIFAGFKSTL